MHDSNKVDSNTYNSIGRCCVLPVEHLQVFQLKLQKSAEQTDQTSLSAEKQTSEGEPLILRYLWGQLLSVVAQKFQVFAANVALKINLETQQSLMEAELL